jgi:preprotein translocase subunit SecA
MDDVLDEYVNSATADGFPEEWDLDKLWRAFKQLYPQISLSVNDVVEDAGGERGNLSSEIIADSVKSDAHAAYAQREEELTPELMREVERRVVLSVLDRKWREHLYEMDYLREGVSLRGYGQRDPLIEYQREGYDMFTAMMEGIKEESVSTLFNAQVQPVEDPIVAEADGAGAQAAAAGIAAASAQPQLQQAQPARSQPVQAQPANGQRGQQTKAQRSQQAGAQQTGRQAQGRHAQRQPGPARGGGQQEAELPAGLARGLDRSRRSGQLSYSAPSDDGSGVAQHSTTATDGGQYANVGRNAPCPCGSGRKFKQCHGDPRNR